MWIKNRKQNAQIEPDNREVLKHEAERLGNELLNASPIVRREKEKSKRNIHQNRVRQIRNVLGSDEEIAGRVHPEKDVTIDIAPPATEPSREPLNIASRQAKQEISDAAIEKARKLIAEKREKRGSVKRFHYFEMLRKADELKAKKADSLALRLYEQCYEEAETEAERAICRGRIDNVLTEKRERHGE